MAVKAIALLVQELHDGENAMTAQLRRAARQHATDYDVRHGATKLSKWSEEHVMRLAEVGRRFDLDLSRSADDGVVRQMREKTAEALGRRPEPALLLLQDLRDLHLCAVGNNIYWEMFSQGAQALRDGELLDLAKACRPQTVRQMEWTNTLIKELSPQALTSM